MLIKLVNVAFQKSWLKIIFDRRIIKNLIQVKSDSCASGKRNGVNCSIVVECDANHEIDPAYKKDGKQILTCTDGTDWTDQNGKTVIGKLNCKPVCDTKKVNWSLHFSDSGLTILKIKN